MGEKGTGEGKEGSWNGTGKRKNGEKRRNGGKGGGMEKDIFVLLYQLDLTRTVHSSPPAVWGVGGQHRRKLRL
jgi:hypothetical protein